ncbi:hypothetical protein GCM10027276_29390 [Comamonas piscis]|uniref:IPTL-CTERM sorting domain-containing protein n=1 Tax=Comamonas sp. B21-038 TaxID=2918299 RepID=UPI001EFADC7E|nr:IPTL-CTERM sorting domain-containing protein [Comamonas sp. B21-038]ULR89769.1 IPTL-CTERM sorting domain-containing protein [Comamonas sp. B21-038]
MSKKLLITGLVSAMACFGAQAAPVYNLDVVPESTFNWASGPDGVYNTGDDLYDKWGQIDLKNNGTASVTGDFAKDGNGSLRLAANGGTSAKAGVAYYPPSSEGFGPLNSITEASFEWLRDSSSASTDAPPVMRLFLFNASNTHVGTLIWLGGDNGASASTNSWQVANVISGTVFQIRSAGPLPNTKMTFAQAQASSELGGLTVRAVEVGFGSGGWGTTFLGAADNIKLSGSKASVDANFEVLPTTFQVNVNTGPNGTSDPAGGALQTVNADGVLSINYTPAAGFLIDTVTGCGGTLSGNVYTTAAVREDCTVTASFKAVAVPPTEAAKPVPTMSQWALALLSLVLGGCAVISVRRSRMN